MSANQKRVWPELVGKDADSVIKTIKQESGLYKENLIDLVFFENKIFTF